VTRRTRRRVSIVCRLADEKSRLEIQTEIFAMITAGGESNLVEAGRQIRTMSIAERLHLRRSVEQLDELLDEIALDPHLARRAR
jgi:hypothetical protein